MTGQEGSEGWELWRLQKSGLRGWVSDKDTTSNRTLIQLDFTTATSCHVHRWLFAVHRCLSVWTLGLQLDWKPSLHLTLGFYSKRVRQYCWVFIRREWGICWFRRPPPHFFHSKKSAQREFLRKPRICHTRRVPCLISSWALGPAFIFVRIFTAVSGSRFRCRDCDALFPKSRISTAPCIHFRSLLCGSEDRTARMYFSVYIPSLAKLRGEAVRITRSCFPSLWRQMVS